MGIRLRGCGLFATIIWLIMAMGSIAKSSQHCPEPIAQIVSSFGMIEFSTTLEERWVPGHLNLLLCQGDRIRTGEYSRAAILFPATDTILRINQNTDLKIRRPEAEDRSFLNLLKGSLYFFSRTPRKIEVRTPYVNAGIEGTEFYTQVADGRTSIIVFEGRVKASNDRASIILEDNQAISVAAGEAPQARALVQPRDAVQWTLYYPPILTDPTDPTASDILRLVSQLLAAGQVNEAANIIAKAPPTGDALTLRTIIAVVKNERETALELGQRAVKTSPDSAAAWIALSYAQQAHFDLHSARDSLQTATQRKPDNALAWARLGELWMSLGYLDQALQAAKTATKIAPKLSRTNTVLGFAHLAQIRTGEAKDAFFNAIALDSQDPLPRLGLGLATIHNGKQKEGRRHIEIATALDPGNSLVRSYLGKAYFDEKRDRLDARQFDIAKKLDSKDPTPWLYDAVRKHSENRPVEGLWDLQKSIELNDNRTVYRSRLLLDDDRAARGAALARIYDELGFQQLAVIEGTKSLGFDPANHSTHRFLSDSYRSRPRHEIASASELLQAQLLQPINVRPVQPQLSETDLNILTDAGSVRPAFNEFTQLFERDQIRLDASGVAGSNSTLSNELVVSGIDGRVSFSVGQFHYESDGFRANNDLQHNIYNVFLQGELSHNLSAQLEYRWRKSEQGDLSLNFDPDNFSEFDRREFKVQTPRVGLHYTPSPRSDFLASMIYTDREEKLHQVNIPAPISDVKERVEGYDLQGQYLYRGHRFNATAGLGHSYIDINSTVSEDFSSFPPICFILGLFPTCTDFSESESSIKQNTAYLHTNITWPKTLIWTLGLSYESLQQGPLDINEINPKLGVQWDFTKSTRLRLAYIETVKRSLVVNQTLEPTQIAGFNQFFDDLNGAEAKRYGIGFDSKLTKNISTGLELSRRELKVPKFLGSSVVFEKEDEELYRAYLYWTPAPEWALRFELQYEDFDRTDPPGLIAPLNLPTSVDTLTVPIGLRYYRTNGFGAGLFAELSASYVNQEVRLPPSFDKSSDEFMLFDALVGYRLPRRSGIISLSVKNLFDKKFLFQDVNIQRQLPNNPRIIPDRTILLRLTLNL